MKCALLTFALLIFSTFTLIGQPKTSLVKEIEKPVTPAIAINPRNPLNVVILAGSERAFISTDGSKSWEEKTITSPHGIHGDPFLVADSKGTLYLFHLSNSSEAASEQNGLTAIICQVSVDGGRTWDGGTPVWVSDGKDQINPAATIDGKGNIHLSWTQVDKHGSNDPECKSIVFLSSSANGRKWSKPIQISQTPGSCGNLMASIPAVADDKRAYVAWLNNDKIFFDRSFDGGAMWLSTDLEVAQEKEGFNKSSRQFSRPAGFPVFVVDKSKTSHNGLLYVTYADEHSSDRPAIWFTRSNDFGDHWMTSVPVAETGEKTRLFNPWMTVEKTSGIIYISYYSQSLDNGDTDIYLAYSKDAGTTFKNVKVNEKSFQGPTDASLFSSIATYKGGIATVWVSNEDGKFSLRISSFEEKDLQ